MIVWMHRVNDKVAVPASAFEMYCADRRELAEALRRDDFTPIPHDRVLACRIALAFERGVARLEPHPDDHPRWKQRFAVRVSRGEQTAFVDDLLDTHLRVCPDDDVVRWLCIAFILYCGDNNFASDLFRPLVARDPMQRRWLIAGAVWVYALSGVDSSSFLRDELMLLRNRDTVSKAAGSIEDAEGLEVAHVRWTRSIGAAVCAGASFSNMSQAGASWVGFPPKE
jgi:hypothetical protein